MRLHRRPGSVFILLILSHLISPSSPSLNSFIYIGCSQLKLAGAGAGAYYDSTLNSILTSIVNAAAVSPFNSFNISLPNDDYVAHVIYALYQCRGDLTNSDCHGCTSAAVARLRASCAGSGSAAVQLEGCFVRYDNASVVGVDDKTVVNAKCGPSTVGDSGRDGALADLTAGGGYFRVSGSGKVKGVAQCVMDLTAMDCQDCVAEAIQRLRIECGSSGWGDMFLGKCYARYSDRGFTSQKRDNKESEKTLAIFIGIVAGIAVIIVILSILRNIYGKKGGK